MFVAGVLGLMKQLCFEQVRCRCVCVEILVGSRVKGEGTEALGWIWSVAFEGIRGQSWNTVLAGTGGKPPVRDIRGRRRVLGTFQEGGSS